MRWMKPILGGFFRHQYRESYIHARKRNAQQRNAMHRNAMQCTATHRNATQRTATHRNARQRNARQCNMPQRTATQRTAMQRNAPQCTAMHRIALQRTATQRKAAAREVAPETKKSMVVVPRVAAKLASMALWTKAAWRGLGGRCRGRKRKTEVAAQTPLSWNFVRDQFCCFLL